MNKSETIEKIIDVPSLVRVVNNLCETSGLIEINRITEGVISAVEKGALKSKTHKFIVTLSELNGKVPQILELVNEHTIESDDVTVLSSHRKGISKYFKDWLKEQTGKQNIDYWDQNDLIQQIDEHLPHYWGHNDLFLKSFEDHFLADIKEEIELKKILKLDKKFESLLNIFIDPKIFIFKEDKETKRTSRVKIQLDRLLKKEQFIISGDAGTGKSTLLKQIGKMAIDANHSKEEKVLPLFIKASDIQSMNYSLKDTIKNLLTKDFAIQDLEKIYEDYHLLLLIDSIDEFEKPIRKSIIEELGVITKTFANFLICTRNYESLIDGCDACDHHQVFLSNFDQRQVKLYLDNFFKFDLAKSDQLWNNLLDNKILERIPVTPLTISLVSILYEEKQYEVPATLTDVYDNFHQFLLGRVTVKSRLEFLDINIKERILSIYAYEIINSPNRERKTKEQFIIFVKDFFSEKSITINEDLVPELLNSLTDGTGILYVNEKGLISFKHDHFMEYYASKEIFISYDRLEREGQLIDKFTKHNWQNTAIFYAGRTKDMPEFLKKLVDRCENYTTLNDCLLAVSGMGYILQSLWMTDSKIRKDGVVKALDLLLRADSRVKQLANEKVHFFDGIRSIDIAYMNLVWFYNHYNSIAIRDPLHLAYESISEEVKKLNATVFDQDKESKLYQLFCIASTLDSGRNSDSSKIQSLFDEGEILSNPFFVLLFEEGSKILESEKEKKLKADYKTKSKLRRHIDSVRFYLDSTSEELRFTTYDKLIPVKGVKIFTEGKTDATIISHAFAVLTHYQEPYWSITSLDTLKKDAGGANELRKHLQELGRRIQTESDKGNIVFGIFDNDAKGNQEFSGLDKDFELINPCLKKHKLVNIYALKIIIPDSDNYDSYRQEKQEFKFFEIEHYFSVEFLKSHNMIRETALKGVDEIIGDKEKFASIVLKEKDEKIFMNFPVLFRAIDDVCNRNVNYVE